MLNSGYDFASKHTAAIIVSGTVFTVLSFTMVVLTRQEDRKTPKGKQPNWKVLEYMNYAVLSVFVSSLSYVIANHRAGKATTFINGDMGGEESPLKVRDALFHARRWR